jgi:hypothetical protein
VIKLLIALWKRPEITRIVFERVKKLPVEPICIYSEDESKELCREFGFESYFFENDPLGRKLNFGVERALESQWDYMMQIGSDDLVKEELIESYKPFIERRSLVFGVGCIYFYDIRTGKTALHYGGQVFGCGRMIHRAVLDSNILKARFRYGHTYSGQVVRKRGQVSILPVFVAEKYERKGIGEILETINCKTKLWSDGRNNGMDFDSEFRLNTIGISVERVDIGKSPFILDIKTEENLHKIDEYNLIDFDIMKYFPEINGIRRLL